MRAAQLSCKVKVEDVDSCVCHEIGVSGKEW